MDTLHQQLSTLEELFQEVAHQYESAATSLREGHLPERTPGFQLEAARKVFTDTLNVLSEVGETYGLAPVSQHASLTSALDYLKIALDAKKEIERQQKLIADARTIVDDARHISHQTNAELLAPVNAALDSLTQVLNENNHEEAELVVKGDHPVSRLIAYTTHRDSLNDEEYDSFRLNIEESFGRSILRDIDRGRITLDSATSFEKEVIVGDVQEDTQNEIIDIIDEIEVDFVNEHEETEEESEEKPEFFEETMHDEHEPFWPPVFEEQEQQEEPEQTLNGEFEIDEDFDPEEDTMTGRLSSNEEATH